MGTEDQKSALPRLFHFTRVRAVSQPHVRYDSRDREEEEEAENVRGWLARVGGGPLRLHAFDLWRRVDVVLSFPKSETRE